tara:strand:+ start:125 stop:550 length:426 start_codon:yes stop_codon:yes gene_type:complete
MAKHDERYEEDTPRTQFVIKDTNAALKIKREERKEAEKRFKAVVEKTKAEQKLVLQKMKLQMTARESASKHIAVFGPLYLLVLVGAFLYAVQYIPTSEISVVSSILTLLITMFGANLRSIVAGETDTGKTTEDAAKKKEAK